MIREPWTYKGINVYPVSGGSAGIRWYAPMPEDVSFPIPNAVNLRADTKESMRHLISGINSKPYQPKTGQACSCRKGQQRDNCPQCEGTGQCIDFKAIRERSGR